MVMSLEAMLTIRKELGSASFMKTRGESWPTTRGEAWIEAASLSGLLLLELRLTGGNIEPEEWCPMLIWSVSYMTLNQSIPRRYLYST